MFVCETCKESVDVSDPDVVYAVEIREALRFIGSEEVEGARRLLP
jgi:adenylyl- and sulfurtransferase ThiI